MGEVSNQPVELSPPPTPPALDFCVDLDCNPYGCHVILFSQPLSSSSFDPLDFGVLCSSILDSTCDVQRIKLSMELVLSIQLVLSFFMSMCGNIKNKSR